MRRARIDRLLEGAPDRELIARRSISDQGSGIRATTLIYDYTFALELLKIGEPVQLVFMRAGERREAMLTPQARR